MKGYRAQSDRAKIEARTIAAHHAYLNALAAWQLASKRCECSRCSYDADSTARLAEAAAIAEAEKERLRLIFRDLMDELGYVPRSGASLPGKPEGCDCRPMVHCTCSHILINNSSIQHVGPVKKRNDRSAT